jgi:hypothetical protein
MESTWNRSRTLLEVGGSRAKLNVTDGGNRCQSINQSIATSLHQGFSDCLVGWLITFDVDGLLR